MIIYKPGDATKPTKHEDTINVILHIVNTEGVWKQGFVKALDKRFSQPKAKYKAMKFPIKQPQIDVVYIDEQTDVVNMVAQKMSGQHKIRYSWLDACLERVAAHYIVQNETFNREYMFHLPKIGTGLGGGVWEDVEWLLKKHLHPFTVVVYEYRENKV